jgi:hypothetical protein
MGLDISLIRIENTPQENCLMAAEWPELEAMFGTKARHRQIEYADESYAGDMFYYTELAYQRKGVTEQFYKNVPTDACLTRKQQVVALLAYMDEEHRDSFRQEFINAFVEGETAVLIGW